MVKINLSMLKRIKKSLKFVVAGVVFRDQQQVARVRAVFFDRCHRRLHGQRQHVVGQIVETARKQVGIDGREFETGIAQVDRAIKRRRVFLPFQAEPAFDLRRGIEDATLQIKQGPGEGGDEMRNHDKDHPEKRR